VTQSSKRSDIRQRLEELLAAIDAGTLAPVKRMLAHHSPEDVAYLLESSPPRARQILWQLIEADQEGEVLQELGAEVASEFLEQMDTDDMLALMEHLEPDDVADILQQLPDRLLQDVLGAMDAQDRRRLERVLSFEEDTAGGLMNTDTITVRPKHTVDVVLRYLRRLGAIPDTTDAIFVVSRSDDFLGILPLAKLLVCDPDCTVREVMLTDVLPIDVGKAAREVATLFQRHDWVSAPVVDADGKLLGRITIDDVVDVIVEEADHSLMSMAGLGEDEDTFAPVLKATPRRAIWLGINLVTAFTASGVINLFEHTIDKVVALAVLMPIVASMGGVAGSQTLTVVVRGMALGQIGRNNARWLLNRELALGALNGMLWALVCAAAATLWFGDVLIGVCIAAAMLINLLAAALSGVMLPMLLSRMRVDPALAGSVVLTTITDAVGFLSFLGLATLFYA
jgi:magnesium transporter